MSPTLTRSAILSALATLDTHDSLLCELATLIAGTAQALMVVSNQPFSAVPDLADDAWYLFYPPGAQTAATLRERYSVAIDLGLDQEQVLALVCELRDIGVRLELMEDKRRDEQIRMNSEVYGAGGWLPASLARWRPSGAMVCDESLRAMVEKWSDGGEREEDRRYWQQLAECVIQRANELLEGGILVGGCGEATNIRRRR